jgi:protein TonB
MPRDFFAATVEPRPKAARARWTVVASILAHAALIGVLVVIPILATGYPLVALAQGIVFLAPAEIVPPPIPPPRAMNASPAPATAPAVVEDAAPSFPPQDPVTSERSSRGGDGPPDLVFDPRRRGDGAELLGPNRAGLSLQQPPPAQSSAPVRPGGAIKPPERIVYVEPVYPPLAIKTKQGARVILEATIDEQGYVRNVRVLRPAPLFEQAAIDAVGRWRYAPTRLNGQPVPVILTVTVNFEITGKIESQK